MILDLFLDILQSGNIIFIYFDLSMWRKLFILFNDLKTYVNINIKGKPEKVKW
jgi:hypothetical protein